MSKSSRIKLLGVHGIKKIADKNTLPEKQNTAPRVKRSIKIKPRIGQGRVRIKDKKPHITKNISVLVDKLWGILKIPAAQNISKNRVDLPMNEQPISSWKTEAITWWTIQDIKREIPFYPDPIYRPPPRPIENLWLHRK